VPRRDIDRLQGEIEELFADLWQVPRFTGLRRGFRPAVDCFTTTDPPELVIVVELAGVDPESIEITVEERFLTIAGNGAGRASRARSTSRPRSSTARSAVAAARPRHRRRRGDASYENGLPEDHAADRRAPGTGPAGRDRGPENADERDEETRPAAARRHAADALILPCCR
jgi:HSP20 family molecular chaperone IbpA